MNPTLRLFRQTCRITLFTRANCSLCDDAKTVLSQLHKRRPFHIEEVDVMAPKQDKWKTLYEFDTPVVHIEPWTAGETAAETTPAARKLMHRFTEQEVEKLMDDV